MSSGLRAQAPEYGYHQQLLAREVNERVRETSPGWVAFCDYICECRDSRCATTVSMRPAEFVRISSIEDAFITAPGHHFAGSEDVVEERSGFVVVRASSAETRASEATASVVYIGGRA